ncbi:hypothetical protein PG984_015026 [Apiospora sp. TS-2023a]
MPSPPLPSLSLGFEFEGWLVTQYKDIDGPVQGRDDLPSSETESLKGQIAKTNFDKNNPAPFDWNPNKGRMPSVPTGNKLLTDVLNVVTGALKTSKLKDSVLAGSEVSEEHPDLTVHKKYNIVRERGTEQNLEGEVDFKKNPSRRDSQVLDQQCYFIGFEFRPRIYEDVRDKYQSIWDELGSVLKELTKRFPISVNAGNDVWFRLPDSIPSETRVVRGESRSGLHIHVGAKGVFEHLEPSLRQKPQVLKAEMVPRILAIKKLLTLYWLVEPNLKTLHASWRSEDARYSGLLRTHSNLAFHPDVKKEAKVGETPIQHWFHEKEKILLLHQKPFYSLEDFNKTNDGPSDKSIIGRLRAKLGDRVTKHGWAAIEIIWSTTNMDQLAWLASSYFGNRRSSLNLHQLLPPGTRFDGGSVRVEEKRTGTLEFRLMQGSFDTDAIAAWTDVVLKMTEVCLAESQDAFVNFVDGVVEKPGHVVSGDKTKAFIERLGLDEKSYAYKFYSDERQGKLDLEADPRHHIFVPQGR